MHIYQATIKWTSDGADFLNGRYSRAHTWSFDGGIEVPASSSPSVVPLPLSSEHAVDPEEAYIASLSSCHMLTFLFLAGRKGWSVRSYLDTAEGHMEKAGNGIPWVATVKLRPAIEFNGAAPPGEELIALHHAAHKQCFIANSVKTVVVVEST